MAIDILGLVPHQVSRDLRGYSVFFYGEPKSGKTTTAAKFPSSLLLAFEKGYSAIPGVMAQPINSWSEFRQVLRQLKSDAAKAAYATIIIDTADIAYDYVSKYICDNAKRPDGGFGVDNIADIPFGKGYGLVSQEFDECLRSIVQMGYGLVLISHATDKAFKDESGQEYNKIVPTLDKRATNIVSRMADIIGYSRAVTEENGNESVKLFMRGTQRYMAGSRFKYTCTKWQVIFLHFPSVCLILDNPYIQFPKICAYFSRNITKIPILLDILFFLLEYLPIIRIYLLHFLWISAMLKVCKQHLNVIETAFQPVSHQRSDCHEIRIF